MRLLRYHGGGIERRDVIDFSTNVNPLGVPEFVERLILESIRLRVHTTYPNSNYRGLRESIASFYNINPDNVIPTSGACEGLNLVLLTLRPKHVITVDPMFGDYDLLCRALRAKHVHYVMRAKNESFAFDLDDLVELSKKFDDHVVIMVNPNNPTGYGTDSTSIIKLAHSLSGILIVDEVYAELSDIDTMLSHAHRLPENVIVVKSFTKLFSIPGVRAGFVYTASDRLAEIIDSARPTWSVSSIADYVVTRALSDHADDVKSFIEQSRRFVRQEREYVASRLRELGLTVFRSCANFLLVRGSFSSIKLRDHLLRRYSVLIRSAHNFYGLSDRYIRISIRRRQENDLLLRALKSALLSDERHEGGEGDR